MPDAVPAIDPATIATAIEANLNASLLSFAHLPGAVLHEEPDPVGVDSGPPPAGLNAVVAARFAPDDAGARIEAVLAHFRRRSRPVTWHVGPSTDPADLGRFLLAHGLVHGEDEP